MGLFKNPRKNKDKWAKLVVANAQPGMDFDEEFLDAATTLYIQQHARILYDSIRFVLNSKNEDTRKERFKLAQQKFGALVAIKKYASRVFNQFIQAIDKMDVLLMGDSLTSYKEKYAFSRINRKAPNNTIVYGKWN